MLESYRHKSELDTLRRKNHHAAQQWENSKDLYDDVISLRRAHDEFFKNKPICLLEPIALKR